MAIPVHILYTIRISKLQRLSAGIVFTVSIITMIVSVVRVVTLNSSTKEGSVTTLWSVVEAAVGISTLFSVNSEQSADFMLIALIVGCLPSFAIFIRGRMEASRVEYFNTSPTILSRTNSHIQSSKGESRTVIGSFIMEDDVELERASSNDINGKGLVDRPVVLTQGWSQK
jgi:hypothetical protein